MLGTQTIMLSPFKKTRFCFFFCQQFIHWKVPLIEAFLKRVNVLYICCLRISSILSIIYALIFSEQDAPVEIWWRNTISFYFLFKISHLSFHFFFFLSWVECLIKFMFHVLIYVYKIDFRLTWFYKTDLSKREFKLTWFLFEL